MTNIQKAAMSDIKAHIKERVIEGPAMFADFTKYLKGMKFISMELDSKREQGERDQRGIAIHHYSVRTRFTAPKYEDNTAVWDYVLYDNGECKVYFDGEEYTK